MNNEVTRCTRPEELPTIMNCREISTFLGVSYRTVMNLIRRGELQSFKVGARVYIAKVQLEAYISHKTRQSGMRFSCRRDCL